jgi:hypothetical protein
MERFVKGDVIGTPFPDSFVKPSILFTVRDSVVLYKAGKIKRGKIVDIQEKIIEILKS